MPHISFIVHSKFFDFTPTTKPSEVTPGGGINSKVWNVNRVATDIKVTNTIDNVSTAYLIEPLWFHESLEDDSDVFETRVKMLEDVKQPRILWCEEQEFLRWTGNQQQSVLGVTDGIFVCNGYLQQLIQEFVNHYDTKILRTPIDEQWFCPKEKRNELIVVGQISHEKNTNGIIELFKALPDMELRDNREPLKTVYIGNAELWGSSHYANRMLQDELCGVADEVILSADRYQVASRLSHAWAYVNMAYYDVGCLSFLEAALSGCKCFCWRYHPMFDEYQCAVRFGPDGDDDVLSNVTDAVKVIGAAYNKGAQLKPDMKIRDEVVALHGYPAFREQLKSCLFDILL